MPTTTLAAQLSAALRSREERHIRRRLPDACADAGLADFASNDYLSLARSPALRARFLHRLAAAPHALGSGGSRLLVNGPAHAALEARLAAFFRAPAALLFNSGFDANVGFFAAVPQPADAVLFDEHIHASVHDGMRASRVLPPMRRPFAHNSVPALRDALERLLAECPDLHTGARSVFLAVETLSLNKPPVDTLHDFSPLPLLSVGLALEVRVTIFVRIVGNQEVGKNHVTHKTGEVRWVLERIDTVLWKA